MTSGLSVFNVWIVFWSIPILGGSAMMYKCEGKESRERCLASKTWIFALVMLLSWRLVVASSIAAG